MTTAPGRAANAVGRVLPGTRLESVLAPHGLDEPPSDPQAPHYPPAWSPTVTPTWLDLDGIAPGRRVRADRARLFNGDDAAYRVAHDESYFGLSPISIGDFDGDGIEDLAMTAHWATVDGQLKMGQVMVYLSRGHGRIPDPRRDVPDLIFYGDQPQERLGIEVAPAGDVNGDGYADMVMSAAFARTELGHGQIQPDAGTAYLVYGGTLNVFRCPTKIRVSDIGTKVPGVILEGGHDGTHLLGWSNTLDSGDFDGDGRSDLVLGAYDPGHTYAPFPARAYLLYGRHLPTSGVLRLGTTQPGLDETVLQSPSPQATASSMLFQTSFIGDVNRDGRDDLAITTGAENNFEGGAYFFAGRPGGLPRGVVALSTATGTLSGGPTSDGAARLLTLSGARPAGDVDGDGYPDIQISARSTKAGGRVVGLVGVLPGGPNSLNGARGPDALTDTVIGAGAGLVSDAMPAMNHGADLNGDGYADLLLNDPYYRENIAGTTQSRGRLWLVLGGPHHQPRRTIIQAADLTFLPDTRFPGLFGFQWNTGDFNGDGRPDILVADHYLGDTERHDFPGGAYLFTNGKNFSP